MSSAPMPGGRRRIDRVLGRDYLAGLPDLSLDELRSKRQEAEQEEADLSYSRRLLQGRIDLLQAELSRLLAADEEQATRSEVSAEGDDALVTRLSRVLADSGGRSDRGLGRYLSVQPTLSEESRREAEQVAGDLALSASAGASEEQLRASLDRVRAVEQEVSGTRRRVQSVMDACTAEIGRRYRDGMAHVDDLLAER